MKNKLIIISIVAVTVIVVSVLGLTNMFTRGAITGKLYRIDNIYEEIWNMVNSEKNGNRTVLTTAIEGSDVDFDFGIFRNITIPVNSEYSVSLSFHQNEFYQVELCVFLYENNGKNYDVVAIYVYNYQSNTLYGDREESLLTEKFTSLYCSWVGNDGKFNLENPGDYTFVFCEYPLSNR